MAGADSASLFPLFFLCRYSSFFEWDRRERHVTEYTKELYTRLYRKRFDLLFQFPRFLFFWLSVVSLLVKPLESLDSFEQHVSTIQFYTRFFESLNQFLQENENSPSLLSFIFLHDLFYFQYYYFEIQMFLLYFKVMKIIIFGFKLI